MTDNFRPDIILPDGKIIDFGLFSEAGMMLKDEIRDELDKELLKCIRDEINNEIILRDNT